MGFSILLFVASWISFFLFANREKFFIIAPTCYVAMILGLSTDILTDAYSLWEYPASTDIQSFWRHILDDIGLYFVIPYLYIQFLPKRQTFLTLARHIFFWSILAILLEWIALKTGNIKHHLWWNIWCSYTSDWILYLIFYSHYKWREKFTK